MKNKGFTLVEILAVVAIIAIISVSAIIGVNSIIVRQREKTASMSEASISEASLAYFTSQKAVYMEACRALDDKYITFNEELLKSINNNLRDELSDISSEEEKIERAKNYVYMVNNDEFTKNEFNSQYTQVKNSSCFKLVTVAELEEKGLFQDTENACDKNSVIIVYQSASSVNTTGTLVQTQEVGICNGKRRQSKHTLLTVTPDKDYKASPIKNIDVKLFEENKKLNRKVDLKYAWSPSPNSVPTNWNDISIITNNKEGNGTINGKDVIGIYYLWIKSLSSIDKNNYKIDPTVFGPYNFSEISVTYDTANGVKCGKPVKEIAKGKAYKYNAKGSLDPLCVTTRTGYNFLGWYTEEGNKVDDETIVTKDNSHVLTARWEGQKINVTYITDGTPCNPNGKEVIFGSKYGALCNTTKENFNFVGWNTEEDGSGQMIDANTIVQIPESHFLYAKWAGRPIEMTYNENGGTPCNPKKVTLYQASPYGSLCETTKEGLSFAGWYDNETFEGEPIDEQDAVEKTEDFEVYAKFEREQKTLTYDSDGGSTCNPESITKYKGEAWGTLCTPTMSGHIFKGWYNLNPVPEEEEYEGEAEEEDDEEEETQESEEPEEEVVLEPVLVTQDSIATQDITVTADWEVNPNITTLTKTIKSNTKKKTKTFTTKKALKGTNNTTKYTCKNAGNIKSCTCVKKTSTKISCTVVFAAVTAKNSNEACKKLAKVKGKGGSWVYIKNKNPAQSKNNYNRASTGSGCYKLIGYSPRHTGSNWICKREPYTLYNARKEHCKYVSGADATYGWDYGRSQCKCWDYLGKNYTKYYEGKIKITVTYKS